MKSLEYWQRRWAEVDGIDHYIQCGEEERANAWRTLELLREYTAAGIKEGFGGSRRSLGR